MLPSLAPADMNNGISNNNQQHGVNDPESTRRIIRDDSRRRQELEVALQDGRIEEQRENGSGGKFNCSFDCLLFILYIYYVIVYVFY